MRPEAAEVGDFAALGRWEAAIEAEHAAEPVPARGAGPLRHLCGVQFFFPANVQFGQEHTLYMESSWRLSSISQVHFWHRRPTGADGYRGIVSVDLGAMFRPLGRAIHGRDDAAEPPTWAWNLPKAAIAEEVFRDVADTIAANTLARRRKDDHDTGRGNDDLGDVFSPVQQGLPFSTVPLARRRSARAVKVALRRRAAAPDAHRAALLPLRPERDLRPRRQGRVAEPLALPHQPPARVGTPPRVRRPPRATPNAATPCRTRAGPSRART